MAYLPDDVEPDTLLSYLRQTLGEPIDRALVSHETDPALPIGWFFEPIRAGRRPDEPDLLVIPFITRRDGKQVAMFVQQAEELATFHELASETTIDNLIEVDQPQREYRPNAPDARVP